MKRITLILLACSLFSAAYATEKGETRNASVSVKIDKSDQVNIQAKYTTLTVESWDKSEVQIEASVRYEGKITDKIQEFLDDFERRVKDNVSLNAGELLIDTDLDLPNKIQIGKKNVGINISYGDELKVFYSIKAPGANAFTISTSYEDARLLGTFDRVDFTQYSGDLQAGIINSGKMSLKYGSAEVDRITNAEFELYEQKLNVRQIGNLKMNAKYSELDFGKVTQINTECYESELEVASLGILEGVFRYGEITISDNLDNADLTLYEVDLEATSVGTLTLTDSKYSEFLIGEIEDLTFTKSYEDETALGNVFSFTSKDSKYGNHTIDVLSGKLNIYAYEDEIEVKKVVPGTTKIDISGKYIDSTFDLQGTSFSLKSITKYGKVEYDESNLEITKYIKDGDQLEIVARSKNNTTSRPLELIIEGYEIKAIIQ